MPGKFGRLFSKRGCCLVVREALLLVLQVSTPSPFTQPTQIESFLVRKGYCLGVREALQCLSYLLRVRSSRHRNESFLVRKGYCLGVREALRCLASASKPLNPQINGRALVNTKVAKLVRNEHNQEGATLN